MSIASVSDHSDVKDDVFMGYNISGIKMKLIQHYKVEVDDISDDEIDQVVPSQSECITANGDDDSVDVLYVN